MYTHIAKYHLVWIPKFRIPLLGSAVGLRLKEIFLEIAIRYGWEIDTIEVMDDHVHLFISFPSTTAIAEAVRILKGISSRRLTEEFPDMEKRIWGAPLWADGYFASITVFPVEENYFSYTVAARLTAKFRNQGKRIGLCHGGFDLLHPGQVKHFESAKKLCDVLIVSITTDRFVTERKGGGCYRYSQAKFLHQRHGYDWQTDAWNYRGAGRNCCCRRLDGLHPRLQLSTTEIIDYIKTKIKDVHILLILDRDGTLITNNEFFGTKDDWKETLEINEPVVSLFSYLQIKYRPTKIVVTN